MKQKNKEKILKAMLIISLGLPISIIAWFMVVTIQHASNNEPTFMVSDSIPMQIAIGIYVVETVITIILLGKVGLTSPKTIAENFSLSTKEFDTLKNALQDELNQNGFARVKEFDESNYKMILYLKSYFDNIYVFALLKMDELTDEIKNDSTEKFWEYISNYSANATSNDIHLIHCICVNRITADFRSFVNTNIKQNFGRYQLPVGISFGGQTAYIAIQKGGWFKGKYKVLRKLFLKLLKNQIKN